VCSYTRFFFDILLGVIVTVITQNALGCVNSDVVLLWSKAILDIFTVIMFLDTTFWRLDSVSTIR
jgi:hypothetical protein